MIERTYECPKCGLSVPRFSGPTPSACPPPKNRARANERLRKQDPALADQLETAGREAKDALDEDPDLEAAQRAVASMLIALTLGLI